MSSGRSQSVASVCELRCRRMLSLSTVLMATCLSPVISLASGSVSARQHLHHEIGKTLIVHDSGDDLSSYSALIELLSGPLNQNLTLRSSDDFSDLLCHECVDRDVSAGQVASESATTPVRRKYGHDSIIILSGPPADDAVASPNATELLDFVAVGGNLFVGADPDVSDDLREVANACGLEFEAHGAFLQDPQFALSTDLVGTQNSEPITNVICNPSTPFSRSILDQEWDSAESRGDDSAAKFDPRPCVLLPGKGTIGMQLAKENMLLTPILANSEDAVSISKSAAGTMLSSRQLGDRLASVVAVRARNGARLVFAGSRHMLNNSFLQPTAAPESDSSLPTGSYDFARLLFGWTLRQQNVFRIRACRGHSREPDAHVDTKCTGVTPKRGNNILALDFSIEGLNAGKWLALTPDSIDAMGRSIVVTADQAGSIREVTVERLEVMADAEEQLHFRCNFSSLPAGWHRVQVAIAAPGSAVTENSTTESMIEIDVLARPSSGSMSRAVVAASCLLAAIPAIVRMANRR